MNSEVIAEHLEREPFEPFRIALSSGESYRVENPHAVALMKTKLFLARNNPEPGMYISYLHIVSVESRANGNGRGNGHSPGRKRRA